MTLDPAHFTRLAFRGDSAARRFSTARCARLGAALLALLIAAIATPARAGDDVVAMFRAAANPGALASWATGFTIHGGARYERWQSPTGAVNNARTRYGRSFFNLDGIDDYLRLSSLASAKSDDGLTVRAWFRPSAVGGTRAVVSNTQQGGYAIRMVDDKIVCEVDLNGSYQRIVSSTSVRLGVWNQATCVVDLDDLATAPVVQLTVVLNGERTFKEVSVPGSPRIRNSAVAPLIGAEPNENGRATTQFFQGAIEAVVVRNYPIELDDTSKLLGEALWLFVAPPEDGTNLGGEPSYWDHQRTNDEPSKTVDQRYADSGASAYHFDQTKVEIHGFVPFINDEYVVQGVASSCESQATCQNERLFVSMYWKDSNKQTARDLDLEATNASLIVELDKNDHFRPKACMKLLDVSGRPNASHAAGLGFHRDKLYLTTGGKALRYPLPNADRGLTCVFTQAENQWDLAESGTLSFSGGYLVATDYCNSDDCFGRALAYVYEVESSGRLVLKMTYAVPDYTEGLEYYGPDGGSIAAPSQQGELIVSYVHGHLDRISAREARCSGAQAPCRYFSEMERSNNGKRLYTGDYNQDTSFNGTRVWSTSESGARMAQRADPTPPNMFPFLFSAIPTPDGWKTVPHLYSDWSLPPLPPIVPPVPPVLSPARPPVGFLDYAANDAISGWASDPDRDAPISVHIYIDGQPIAAVTADSFRPDVGARGFSFTPPKLAHGQHRVEVYAIGVDNLGGPDHFNPQLQGSPADYYEWDFLKPGNNGTVSCTTFCEGAQFGEVGGCVGASRTDSGQRVDCFTRTGLLPADQQLLCECERGFIKPGNNGTVSCATFCDGEQWGPPGRCVGAVRSDTGQPLSCSQRPGLLTDAELTCQCVPKIILI